MKKTVFTEPTTLNGWRELDGLRIEGIATRVFTKGGCRVLVSQNPERDAKRVRWHLSISRTDRYPGWNEIKDARYALLPEDITMAMILPPPEQYVNIHPNCFHLHEIDGDD